MELNNDSYLQYIAKKGKPIVLSTGMGTAEEVDHAIGVIKDAGNKQLCLLHCISIYPCDYTKVNLRNINWLKEEYQDCIIGFSDHSIGIEMATAAVALGARVIEKHFTLDKSVIGMDNQMATEPEDMKRLVDGCQNVFNALGQKERIVCQEELNQRLKMRRSLVYTSNLSAGHLIAQDDLCSKRPGTGFSPNEAKLVIGKTLVRDVNGDTLVQPDDFN